MERDSATFRGEGKEVPSLSQDKGTSSKSCQETGWAGTACQIRDGTWDGMVPYFDSLSHPAGQNPTEQKRTFLNRNGCSKTGKNVLNQEIYLVIFSEIFLVQLVK